MIEQGQETAEQLLAEATAVIGAMFQVAGDEELKRAFSAWGTLPAMGKYVVVSGLVIPSTSEHLDREVRFLVGDDIGFGPNGKGSWRYQASVLKSNSGDWYVNWFKPLCTGCFGSGVLDESGQDEVCGVCGGDGWGLLGSRPYPYRAPQLVRTA